MSTACCKKRLQSGDHISRIIGRKERLYSRRAKRATLLAPGVKRDITPAGRTERLYSRRDSSEVLRRMARCQS